MKLISELILVSQKPANKTEAIKILANKLADNNKIHADYIHGFIERETIANTYLGKGIAIPHGVPESRHLIKETAIAVMQIPEGLVWGENDEKVYLVVAIAAQGDEHLQVLRKLTRLLNNQSLLDDLFNTDNPLVISNALNDEQADVNQFYNQELEFTNEKFTFNTEVVLPNPQGMHARPASKLQKLIKSLGTQVVLESVDGRRVDASKMFDVLGLGLAQDSVLNVLGNDEQAVAQVVASIALGLGDDLSIQTAWSANQQVNQQKVIEYLWQPEGDIKCLTGVPASDGLVIGKVAQYGQQEFQIPTEVKSALDESIALDKALQDAMKHLYDLMSSDNVGTEEMAIFEAHLSILDDVDLVAQSVELIADGKNAPQAYKQVSDERIQKLSAVANTHIAARASDIKDVQKHVMTALLGIEAESNQYDVPVIICAEDLTPSDTIKLSPDSVLGFVTELGGPTGHSAIIARNMGLPAIVAAGKALKDVQNGTKVILDGTAGILYLNPTTEQLASAQISKEKLLLKQKQAELYRSKKAQTKDGHMVEVCANSNEVEKVNNALEMGAEGVGLMRTEMLYLSSKSVPSEDFQYEKYLDMAKALGDKPLIIRTLDIGGDKEVDYLGLAKEENAFLGIRGIRLCFERPDLFMPQLRAIYRVAKEQSNVHIMFPMIGKLSDWHRAKAILDDVRYELDAPKIPVGIMVEVPSAALMAPQFAQYVDFFSIGTNDLTQYTLAMDRMHPILASQTDAMHPAVLRLIDMTIKSAHQHGKWVGVCGNAAGDITSAKVLVGLGVDELSMSPVQIATIKQTLDQYNYADLQKLAKDALAQESSEAVRQLLAQS